MIFHNVKQRSPEWDALRCGIPTASCFHKIITPATLKLSSQAENYMDFLLAEWIIGLPLESFESEYMQAGQALEGQAVRAYEFERKVDCHKIGFVSTDDKLIGCSPDRIVVGGGFGTMFSVQRVAEIKTHPGNPGIQVCAMRNPREIDQKHMLQVQGQIWLCEADVADVVNYTPGFPTVVTEVGRSERIIKAEQDCLGAFVETMLKAREALTQAWGPFTRHATALRSEVNADLQTIYDEFRPVI